MNKYILLLASFALSIYFYNKGSTDFLLIMFLFIIFIATVSFNNLFEHAENVSQGVAPNEAIQNLASIYNSKKMIVDEIEAKKITVKGKYKDFVVADGWISSSDGINCNGLNSALYVNTNEMKANNKITVGAKNNLEITPEGEQNTIINAKNQLQIINGELFLYAKGGTYVGSPWSDAYSGNLIVKGNGGNVVKSDANYYIQSARDSGNKDGWVLTGENGNLNWKSKPTGDNFHEIMRILPTNFKGDKWG